jgi:apolipoprotein D and lipocalin family protein
VADGRHPGAGDGAGGVQLKPPANPHGPVRRPSALHGRLDDGRIATTFTFNDGGYDGEHKTFTPTGFIRDRKSNAVWGMRFVWPIKADYRIVYVDEHYQQTIIGRLKRDYVWIMARSPQIPAADMQRLVDIVAEQGYDTSKLRPVPQRWPDRSSKQGDPS